MGNVSTRGIVIKQTNYGEADRMLTIFTEEYGIIKAAARGVRRMNSRRAAAAQFLCYCDFELFMTSSEISSVNNISVVDAFFPAGENIVILSLFTYISDIIIAGMGYSNPDNRILKLFLNTLYMCAYKNFDVRMAKSVFELRYMAYIGFLPMLGKCADCGNPDIAYFDLNCGTVCKECHGRHKDCIKISEDVYHAVCYILASEEKKMFSFRVSEKVLDELSKLTEKYTSFHLDRKFSTLDYFKSMLTNE